MTESMTETSDTEGIPDQSGDNQTQMADLNQLWDMSQQGEYESRQWMTKDAEPKEELPSTSEMISIQDPTTTCNVIRDLPYAGTQLPQSLIVPDVDASLGGAMWNEKPAQSTEVPFHAPVAPLAPVAPIALAQWFTERQEAEVPVNRLQVQPNVYHQEEATDHYQDAIAAQHECALLREREQHYQETIQQQKTEQEELLTRLRNQDAQVVRSAYCFILSYSRWNFTDAIDCRRVGALEK